MKKADIVEILTRDQKAYEAGFNTLCTGQVYMKQVTHNALLFIIMNDSGKFDAWRETWSGNESKKSNVAKSVFSKDIVTGSTFDYALLKAKQYLDYLLKGRKTK